MQSLAVQAEKLRTTLTQLLAQLSQALGKYRFAGCTSEVAEVDLKLIVSRNNALNQLSKGIIFNAEH